MVLGGAGVGGGGLEGEQGPQPELHFLFSFQTPITKEV